MAGVSVSELEQLTLMPSTPCSASCSTVSACFWASSSLGVRQRMVIFTPRLAPISAAASSAPTRAAWKTGLPWLLAMRAKVYSERLPADGLVPGAGLGLLDGADDEVSPSSVLPPPRNAAAIRSDAHAAFMRFQWIT